MIPFGLGHCKETEMDYVNHLRKLYQNVRDCVIVMDKPFMVQDKPVELKIIHPRVRLGAFFCVFFNFFCKKH